MLIDVVDLVSPSAAFRATSYLAGSTQSITYLSPPDADGVMDLAYIKSLTGWPVDGMRVCADSIRQRVTENIWGDPTSAKIVLGNGVPRLPRFIDYSPNQPAGVWGTGPNGSIVLLQPPQTTYYILGPGSVPTAKSDNKICRCTFRGPYPGAAIGDLPVGQDWEEWYERGSADGITFPVMEKVTHRAGFGRYMWDQFKWSGTGYIPDINPATGLPYHSQNTKIMPLAAPVIPTQKIF